MEHLQSAARGSMRQATSATLQIRRSIRPSASRRAKRTATKQMILVRGIQTFDCSEKLTPFLLEDERSIANKLAREEKVHLSSCLRITQKLMKTQRQNEPDPISKEAAESQKDPTLPVGTQFFSFQETCILTMFHRPRTTATSLPRVQRSMQNSRLKRLRF